jgi:hypothetical protein
MFEYQKVVDLWAHEGKIAWDLISVWAVLQVGLGSAVSLLYVQHVPWRAPALFTLFIAGAIVNFAWIFIIYRAKMRRENWFCLGLEYERQLNGSDRFGIFEIERRVREGKKALELYNGSVRERRLSLSEKAGALKVVHFGVFLMLAVWIILIAHALL